VLKIAEVIFAHAKCPLIVGAFRVVAIDVNRDICALVRLDVDHPKSPFQVSLSSLMHRIEAQEIESDQEFALDLSSSEEELNAAELAELHRVEAYFSPLLEAGIDVLILNPRIRREKIAEQSSKCHVHERTIEKHFNLYLWAGMSRFGLLGERNRRPRMQKEGSKRRGPEGEGPALPAVRAALEDGCRLHYLPGEHTLLEAYALTLKDSFTNQDCIPTLRQFRYVSDCLKGKEAKRPSDGQNQPRVPIGKSRDHVLGPGYRSEVDGTRFQVQLVSQFGRQFMIGEASACVTIDDASGAYTGWAVKPGPPNWDLVRAALLNAFTDKTQEFERLDLPYTSEDMPVKEIPTRLTADRAELLTNNAGVVPDMGIKVEIMPPMRPDRKGQIERSIGAVKNQDNFYFIPGSHVKNPGRRVDDGKSSASLTIKELERLYVEKIMDLNLEPVPLSEIPTALVDAGYHSITRIGLYHWMLENRPGHYRTLSPIEVFTFLLNKADATATSVGITYKKMTFRSDRLRELGYDAESKPITIGYTDRADQVWFYDEQACELVAAQNDHKEIRRAHATFDEAKLFLKKADQLRFQAKLANVGRRAEKAARINKETRTAAREAKEARKPLTKTAAKREIRKNQGAEVVAERIRRSVREREKFDADTSTSSPAAEHVPKPTMPTNTSPNRLRDSISVAWEQAN
jgi:hypothetical protein